MNRSTGSGLNRLVTTTLSEEDREQMELVRRMMGVSCSGFVKRAIQLLIMEEQVMALTVFYAYENYRKREAKH